MGLRLATYIAPPTRSVACSRVMSHPACTSLNGHEGKKSLIAGFTPPSNLEVSRMIRRINAGSRQAVAYVLLPTPESTFILVYTPFLFLRIIPNRSPFTGILPDESFTAV
jgi:hypothetical protein